MAASLETGGWRAELDGLLARLGRLFVRAEPRGQAGRYLEGLLGPVRRKNGWQLEVTFQETRTHLGVETQRQWSDRAIACTTPCLLGLFSLITLLGAELKPAERAVAASSAWYRKNRPTFSDTLAAVRRQIWQEQGLLMSRRDRNVPKPRPALQRALAYAICHAT